MVQIIKMKDDMITGVKYELVVIPEPNNKVPAHIASYKKAQNKVTKCHTQKQTRIRRK